MEIKTKLLSNTFLCSVLLILVLVGNLFDVYPLQYFELKAYDTLLRLRETESHKPHVALVAIDQKSIDAVGNWPWPRSYIAEMIKTLAPKNARTMGVALLYDQKDFNDGLGEVKKLNKSIQQVLSNNPDETATINKLIQRSEERLNHDERLYEAILPTKRIVLPFIFKTLGTSPKAETQNGFPEWLTKHGINDPYPNHDPLKLISGLLNPATSFYPSRHDTTIIKATHPDLAKAAGAHGHINILPDCDGVVRNDTLLINHNSRLYPSMSLQMALAFSDLKLQDLHIEKNRTLFVTQDEEKKRIARTDLFYRNPINLNEKNYTKHSFIDVSRGKVPQEAFQDKAVIIGLTAPDIAAHYKTPTETSLAGIEIIASSLAGLIAKSQIVRPNWAWALETAILIYFGFFILLILPRVSARMGAIILASFLAVWFGIAVALFLANGFWFKITTPFVLAFCSLAIITANKKFSLEALRSEHSETYKMLGLSFQGQGMLDMALEYFMKCPIKDITVKEKLYNLGLDFERKRMFNKAATVYEYIRKAGKFKDTEEKIARLKATESKVVLGNTSTIRTEATMRLDTVDTTPTLGRYEIVEVLGQGAIGTIYLGRDPKINREVAIKTLRYEESDSKNLKDIKERFLHEAEAAGKLNHPNIVTIYDVGEDMDVVYMAMELLKGEDLTAHIQKETLLPIKDVIEIIIQVADALHYAHKNGVVHRDIKPANIMLLDKNKVKVTDFGIARMMAASQTQTGVILGTPNYMSPEQVLGKKVDGRSDLFSLGSVFYEMLTAVKPFKQDNIGPLMHNIANANFKPLSDVAPLIPDCCEIVIKKLLAKDPIERFQNADTLSRRLKECLGEI